METMISADDLIRFLCTFVAGRELSKSMPPMTGFGEIRQI